MSPIAALRALSPFGPIFGKELRTTARRRRTYLLRVLYLLSLMLFLFFAYAESRSFRGSVTSVAQRAAEQAELGFMFFVVFSMFSVIAMAILGPILTATAIGGERLHKTLHVLLITPINAWQIVAGKLLSRLWIALTLLALSLPAVAVVRLLGGVELHQMFAIVCLCVVTALFTAAVGLFLSTLINRAYAVLLLSFAALLFLYLFLPFLVVAFFEPAYDTEYWIAPINPILMTAFVLRPWGPDIHWYGCVAIHLAMTVGLVLSSALLLRREARREGSASPLDAATSNQLQTSRPVSDNPVLWRETRRPLFARRWQRVVAGLACVALLLLTYAAAGFDRSLAYAETHIVFAVAFHLLFLLLTCILAATAIAQEKESDTWTTLIASPVTGRQVVIGKLLGLLRRLFWPAVLVIGHFLVFTITDVLHPVAFLLAIWLILPFNAIWIATGLYLSLRLARTTFAVVLNLLIPLIVYLFAFIFAATVDNVVFGYQERLVELVAFYTPYGYLGGIEHWSENRFRSRSGVWTPLFGYSDKSTHLATALAVGMMYLAASAALIGWIIIRFDRIVGRAHQRASAR